MEGSSKPNDSDENDNQYPSGFNQIKGLMKEMAWLRKNPRACHFFLFYLITEFSEWAEQNVRPEDESGSDISKLQEWYQSIESQFNGPLRQAEAKELPPGPELPEALIPQFNNNYGIETRNENSAHLTDSLMENSSSCDDKKAGDSKTDCKLPPVDLMHANGVSNARLKNSINIRNSFLSVIQQLYIRNLPHTQMLKLILYITSLWTTQSNKFPAPFSWLNSKNKDHCQWLWDEMHKRCIGIPFKYREQAQQWNFVIATFDNWKGWTIAQEAYLTTTNPKRKPGKFLSGGLDPGKKEIEHKKLLLDELKKAWDQKERRAKKAKEPTVVKLTKAAQKKLEFIAHQEKTTSKDILNELIDNAFNDAKRKSQQS